MSPGATFERVYRELRQKLHDGRLAPGTPIEPLAAGAELGASITPVRDALHRLVGERLVEAPRHNGFRVPLVSEAQLRDLYGWSSDLLGLAVARMRFEAVDESAEVREEGATAASRLFLAMARATGSGEHAAAVAGLNSRLAVWRQVEARALDQVPEELDALRALLAGEARAGLRRALVGYHRRRTAAVPRIRALLTGSE